MENNPLKVVIVDDEDKAQKNLKALLDEFVNNIEVVGMSSTVDNAVTIINEISPEIVFLDVKMKGETGFDLLTKLDNIQFEVIFITAYNEYALKAFRFSAIDYLLKPVNIEELQMAVEKVRSRKKKTDIQERLSHFISNVKSSENVFNKIALPTLEGLIFIHLKDIIRCESAENYTYFYMTSNEKILVSKTIKYFEELLSDHHFYRVHRSHLVNLNHIKKYHKGDGGYLIMSDDSEVMVSRRKKEGFLKLFN